MTDPISIARQLAREHPDGQLGCPSCDASLKAANLDRHLGKVHGDGSGSTNDAGAWRGTERVKRGRLSLEGSALVLRRALRRRRSVPLPAPVAAGGARVRSGGVHSSTHDYITETIDESAGTYLRIGGGRRSIVVRCRSGGGVHKHWRGWVQGPLTRRWHITLSAADFAALQYVLADHGVLQLRRTQT